MPLIGILSYTYEDSLNLCESRQKNPLQNYDALAVGFCKKNTRNGRNRWINTKINNICIGIFYPDIYVSTIQEFYCSRICNIFFMFSFHSWRVRVVQGVQGLTKFKSWIPDGKYLTSLIVRRLPLSLCPICNHVINICSEWRFQVFNNLEPSIPIPNTWYWLFGGDSPIFIIVQSCLFILNNCLSWGFLNVDLNTLCLIKDSDTHEP